MLKIEIRHDKKRGCGWRKPGGLYLVSGGLMAPCGKLPIPLKVCPTCGHGIKPSRGWTWLDGNPLVKGLNCKYEGEAHCLACPMSGEPGKVGLLWVGEKFYKIPDDFTREAAIQGISRRISSIPNEFKLGETWIWFAHRKAIEKGCSECKGIGRTKDAKCKNCNGEGKLFTSAIFQAFKPTAIEYVVKGNESEEELERLIKRGITPIKIERVGETKELEALAKK